MKFWRIWIKPAHDKFISFDKDREIGQRAEIMLTPQIGSIGPLANTTLLHPEALFIFLQHSDGVVTGDDWDAFQRVLPCLETHLVLEGCDTRRFQECIAVLQQPTQQLGPIESIRPLAGWLCTIPPARYRCAANRLMLSGELYFDVTFDAADTRLLAKNLQDDLSRVSPDELLEKTFTHDNPALLLKRALTKRKRVVEEIQNAINEGGIRLSETGSVIINSEFLDLVWVFPDIYMDAAIQSLDKRVSLLEFVAWTIALASIPFSRGEWYLSAYLCQAGYDAVEKDFEPQDPDLVKLFTILAQSYHALRLYVQATQYYEKLLGIAAAQGGEEDVNSKAALFQLASINLVLGEYERARDKLELLVLTEKRTGQPFEGDSFEGNRWLYFSRLAFAQDVMGNPVEARRLYVEMLKNQFQYILGYLDTIFEKATDKERIRRAIKNVEVIFRKAVSSEMWDPSALWRFLIIDWNHRRCNVAIDLLYEYRSR